MWFPLEPTLNSYGWMFWNGLVYSANLKTAAALESTTVQQADWDRAVSTAHRPVKRVMRGCGNPW